MWTPAANPGNIVIVNTPVTPYVLAGRILSILGMGFFAAVAILLFLVPSWTWALAATAAFFPFLGLIILVEKYSSKHGLIGAEEPRSEPRG